MLPISVHIIEALLLLIEETVLLGILPPGLFVMDKEQGETSIQLTPSQLPCGLDVGLGSQREIMALRTAAVYRVTDAVLEHTT